MLMRQHRLYLGAVAALAAGVAFGYGLGSHRAAYWLLGYAGLAAAALLVLSGLRCWRSPSKLYDESKRQGEMPLLGELLVRKYRLITEDELELALARQRRTRRRLGVELVKMGLLTLSQLAGLLEEQLACQTPAAPSAKPQPSPSPEPAATSSATAQVR